MKYTSLIFVALLLMAALSSCGQDTANPQNGPFSPGWESLGIDNYEMDQRVNCFCVSPPAGRFHKITVRGNKIVSAVDLQDGRALPEKDFSFFKTIAELIAFVDSIEPDSVAVYDVRMDSDLNYPSFIYIDFDSRIADEEIGYETRNVHPLR